MTLKKLVFLVNALGAVINQTQECAQYAIPPLTEVCNPIVLGPLLAGLVFAEQSFFISQIYNQNPLNFGDLDFCLLNACCSLGIAREIVINRDTIMALLYVVSCVMGLHSLVLASHMEWLMPWVPFCTMASRRCRSISIWLISSFTLADLYRLKLQSVS
jgi:hypothetical protein